MPSQCVAVVVLWDGFVTAVDCGTGEILWSVRVGDAPLYSRVDRKDPAADFAMPLVEMSTGSLLSWNSSTNGFEPIDRVLLEPRVSGNNAAAMTTSNRRLFVHLYTGDEVPQGEPSESVPLLMLLRQDKHVELWHRNSSQSSLSYGTIGAHYMGVSGTIVREKSDFIDDSAFVALRASNHDVTATLHGVEIWQHSFGCEVVRVYLVDAFDPTSQRQIPVTAAPAEEQMVPRCGYCICPAIGSCADGLQAATVAEDRFPLALSVGDSRFASHIPMELACTPLVRSKDRLPEIEGPSFFQQHYDIVRVLCWGESSIVVCARERTSDMSYAVKIVPMPRDAAYLHEAKKLASLEHEHIVRYHASWVDNFLRIKAHVEAIHPMPPPTPESTREQSETSSDVDIGQCSSCLVVVMELLSGTLTQYIKARPFVDESLSARILLKVVAGLKFLHERGIVHRDIKPDNIFVDPGRGVVKIGDLGISRSAAHVEAPAAKAAHMGTRRAETTRDVGTPLYASPEQLSGRAVLESDLYSLAVVALELFSEFGTDSERRDTIKRAKRGEIPQSVAAVCPSLAKCIASMLSQRPRDRCSLDDLQSVLLPLTDLPLD